MSVVPEQLQAAGKSLFGVFQAEKKLAKIIEKRSASVKTMAY